MSAEHPPLPHPLPSALRNLQSAYETLLNLAHRQYACIQSDDIVGLHRVLERKTALIAAIDSSRDGLLSELARLNKSFHLEDALAQWQDEVRRLLSDIDALDRRSVLALQQRLSEEVVGLSTLAEASRLLSSYRQTSSTLPRRCRYLNRRL